MSTIPFKIRVWNLFQAVLCSDGTLPVWRRRRTHAFGGGDNQSCLRPNADDDDDDSEGDAGTYRYMAVPITYFLCDDVHVMQVSFQNAGRRTG